MPWEAAGIEIATAADAGGHKLEHGLGDKPLRPTEPDEAPHLLEDQTAGAGAADRFPVATAKSLRGIDPCEWKALNDGETLALEENLQPRSRRKEPLKTSPRGAVA